jgi:Fe-S-cluster containining protein
MNSPREHVNAAAASVEQHTTNGLGQRRDGETCEAVCRQLVHVIESEFDELKAAGAAIACVAGCNFCCHLRVGVHTHEAIALLNYLRTSAPRDESAAIERRIQSNARKIDGMTVSEHHAARIPCALLVNGRCAAYDVRPSACARYHSMSRSRCEHSYNNPHDVGTPRNSRPALLELQVFGAAVGAAAETALERAGLSTATAELHQLLRSMIEDPALIERWFAGEDVAATLTPS